MVGKNSEIKERFFHHFFRIPSNFLISVCTFSFFQNTVFFREAELKKKGGGQIRCKDRGSYKEIRPVSKDLTCLQSQLYVPNTSMTACEFPITQAEYGTCLPVNTISSDVSSVRQRKVFLEFTGR